MLPPCQIRGLFGFTDPCQGIYDRCHIGFDKQTLKHLWGTQDAAKRRGESYIESIADQPMVEFIWDHRVVRWGCRHHHFQLDQVLKLRRDQLPGSVEEFAAEHGSKLTGRLTRDYGRREELDG